VRSIDGLESDGWYGVGRALEGCWMKRWTDLKTR
jgi:hypothetical protein